MDNWRDEFESFILQDRQNIDYLADTETQAKQKDIGLINEDNGAGLLIREDSSIECSSDFGLGFKLDPKYKAMLLFAPNLHIFSDNIQTHKALNTIEYINGDYEKALEIVQQNKGW